MRRSWPRNQTRERAGAGGEGVGLGSGRGVGDEGKEWYAGCSGRTEWTARRCGDGMAVRGGRADDARRRTKMRPQ